MTENTFIVILKDNKPFIKWTMTHTEKTYLRIWDAKGEKPYVKYMSGYFGKTYLSDDMKEDLQKLLNK